MFATLGAASQIVGQRRRRVARIAEMSSKILGFSFQLEE